MSRLNNQILNAIVYRPLERFIDVINLFAVALCYMVNDDIGSEAAAYRVIRERLLQLILDGADGQTSAVIKAGAKAEYQQFVFTDVVLIARVVLRRITGVVVFFFLCCFAGTGAGIRLCGSRCRAGVLCCVLAVVVGRTAACQPACSQHTCQQHRRHLFHFHFLYLLWYLGNARIAA